MPEGFSVLCTGDLHLGRHPTRIPEDLDGSTFSPGSVWHSTVEAAIEHEVDAVVVTGDIVDRENRYFEAYGAFERGAADLDAADIPTVVVSGNHDFDVLPSLVESVDVDHLHFLGANQTWERWTVEDGDGPGAHLDCWSFANEHFMESPLSNYDLEEDSSAPIIGVLHGDLDDQESSYAPIDSSDLASTPVDAWLLGHIHKPGLRRDADPLVLYPGSPQPLDPGEPGQHGVWLLTWRGDGRFDCEQLPLANVRYEAFDVDVEGVGDTKEVAPLVKETISEHVEDAVDTTALELLLARIRLEGRTDAHADLLERRNDIKAGLDFPVERLSVRIESMRVDTRPAVDLVDLADGDSPVAHLASMLLDLDGGTLDERQDLLEAAMDALWETHQSNAYTPLRRVGQIDEPDRELAGRVLREQGRLLLDTLLDQKEVEAE